MGAATTSLRECRVPTFATISADPVAMEDYFDKNKQLHCTENGSQTSCPKAIWKNRILSGSEILAHRPTQLNFATISSCDGAPCIKAVKKVGKTRENSPSIQVSKTVDKLL